VILGVDIGGTRIKAGLVGEDGALVRQSAIDTPRTIGEFRDALAALVGQFEDWSRAGIGAKGIINPETTRVEVLPGTMHYLEGHRLDEFIPGAAADNDARAAMAGEIRWGAARGCRNALMLTLGTGIGGAILADSRMLRGANGIAGHVGHFTIDPDGPPCICGNRGCLETAFSSTAIESEALALLRRGCDTSLPQNPTCRQVFDCAAGGDDAARWVVDRAIYRLGAGIAGLVHLLDPELIVIGGQVAAAGAALLGPLAHEVHWRTRGLLRRDIPLVPQQAGDNSGIVGAAALVTG
jgi:glucokinase